MGGDGTDYTGAPDLQAAISLVTAGGAPGSFSITTALTSLVGADAANAEVAKLTKQYGARRRRLVRRGPELRRQRRGQDRDSPPA